MSELEFEGIYGLDLIEIAWKVKIVRRPVIWKLEQFHLYQHLFFKTLQAF